MIDFCNYKWTTEMEGGRLIHPKQPWMWYDKRQVIVNSEYYNNTKNWCAILYAEEKHTTIHHWDGKIYEPTVACGIIRSVETFGYGHFSAEIKLPRGRNLWPAFWLVGSDEPWPRCGEIDIMEGWTNHFGGYFRLGIPQPPYVVPSWDTTTNMHWEVNGEHGFTGSRRLPIIFSLRRPAHNFIKYEVEWRPNIITFSINDHCVRTYGYDVAMHLLSDEMHVVFDLWTTGKDFTCLSPMIIKNFEYKPLNIM